MKARFVFACAAAGIAMTAFGATTASADEFVGSIGITPEVARPGDSVEIFATCNDPNFTTAKINSQVLDATELTGTDDGAGGYNLRATATVKADATPEWWPVSFLCGDVTVSGNFLVSTPDVSPLGQIFVAAENITPGKKVNIHAECFRDGFISSPVVSPALEPVTISHGQGEGSDVTMMATTTVRKDAKPGEYPISFTCDGQELSSTFTVVAGKAKPVTPAKKEKVQVPVKPKGAADTGSLDRPAVTSAPAEESNSGLYVLGGTVLAGLGAAGGLGTWAYRRRQRA